MNESTLPLLFNSMVDRFWSIVTPSGIIRKGRPKETGANSATRDLNGRFGETSAKLVKTSQPRNAVTLLSPTQWSYDSRVPTAPWRHDTTTRGLPDAKPV